MATSTLADAGSMTDLIERDQPEGLGNPSGPPGRTQKAPIGDASTARTYTEDDPDGSKARQRGARAETAVAIVDHGFHAVALLARGAFYLLMNSLSAQVDVGQHLLAGLLLGDFVAGIAIAWQRGRLAPQATLAEMGLFAGLLVWWWSGYEWPKRAEYEALLLLFAVGAAAGRLGKQARGTPGWD